MDNVPVRVNGSAPAGRPTDATNEGSRGNKSKNKSKRLVIAASAVVLIIVILLAGWLIYRSSMAAIINRNEYQAVFFTNGQVYFGKLQNLNGSYFKLTDVFYLQAQNDNSKNPQQTSSQQDNNVQLVKLGNEIHGPDDEMIVSKDQVLFFENLKKDGKVSSSINQYVSQRK